MAQYHVAQVNIGRVRAPVDEPLMAGFTGRLDELNRLADSAPGFVWRLQTSEGNATYFRPYPEDDRILVNMSVWETIESLRHYVYKTVHAELLRQRHEWFEKFTGVYTALWWVPARHRPGLDGAVLHRQVQQCPTLLIRQAHLRAFVDQVPCHVVAAI